MRYSPAPRHACSKPCWYSATPSSTPSVKPSAGCSAISFLQLHPQSGLLSRAIALPLNRPMPYGNRQYRLRHSAFPSVAYVVAISAQPQGALRLVWQQIPPSRPPVPARSPPFPPTILHYATIRQKWIPTRKLVQPPMPDIGRLARCDELRATTVFPIPKSWKPLPICLSVNHLLAATGN